MNAPVVGTGLRFALAFGAPPAAVTGFATASANNHFFRLKTRSIRLFTPETLD